MIVYFLDKVGTDMENIQGELEKVFCYALERDTITKEDIDAVCVTQITNHIFEMVDAVAAGNQQKALDLYYELLALKEPPMRILFLLVRQYRMLFHVKALANQGYGRKEIASKDRIADRQSCGRTFYCKTVRKIDGGKKYCQQLIRVILEIFVL